MTISLPEFGLVLLVGPTASGKSTFARRHFAPTEIVSSDVCRGLVGDYESDQTVTGEAFELLQTMVRLRLQLKKLVVVDATNLRFDDRQGLLAIAAKTHALASAIVFDVPESLLRTRNPDHRGLKGQALERQMKLLRDSLRKIKREGFANVFVVDEKTVSETEVRKVPLWTDKRSDAGPFDIVGDVHACHDEFVALLDRLGWQAVDDGTGVPRFDPPAGRRLVLVGDLADRGPKPVETFRVLLRLFEEGKLVLVQGNHDKKLVAALKGRPVQKTHGLAETLAALDAASDAEALKTRVRQMIDRNALSHFMFDGGRLCVAHAGLTEDLQGRASSTVRAFAMYGDVRGETDEDGLPVRHDWAADYRGQAAVIYGHTPVAEAVWRNNTLCIDTGCCFGGRLTAVRWPEREIVQVEATAVHAVPPRPLHVPGPAIVTRDDHAEGVADIAPLLTMRKVETELMGMVKFDAANAAAAIETLSRFGVDPRWLVYLPPTMAPVRTSQHPTMLERPEEAFAHFAQAGVGVVHAQLKHMGSRALAVVCRDETVARRRFGVSGADGIVYTRTGRRFFEDPAQERAVLDAVRKAMDRSNSWNLLETDWVLLDGELMPWSAKAGGLLRGQYAPTSVAALMGLPAVAEALAAAAGRGVDLGDLPGRVDRRIEAVGAYRDAWRGYCWDVTSPDDLRFAPFHLLTTEGRHHMDRPHNWHMERIDALAKVGAPIVTATERLVLDPADPDAVARAARWWEEMTEAGVEGMVVKPAGFTVRGQRGVIQPGIKVRGPEYLRIIYGPEYREPANLDRLRARSLGTKSRLALQEFALGREALRRFVGGASFTEVHACVFAILALESEPLDPRL